MIASYRMCLGRRMETDDAGCCRKWHPCRTETCGTEEPDEGNPHVRICGGLAEQSLVLPGRTLVPEERYVKAWDFSPRFG
jgi:hypothetical protein